MGYIYVELMCCEESTSLSHTLIMQSAN